MSAKIANCIKELTRREGTLHDDAHGIYQLGHYSAVTACKLAVLSFLACSLFGGSEAVLGKVQCFELMSSQAWHRLLDHSES